MKTGRSRVQICALCDELGVAFTLGYRTTTDILVTENIGGRWIDELKRNSP